MENIIGILSKICNQICPYLDEKVSRLFLGSCAASLGHGGIGAVANMMKVNRDTVSAGKQEIERVNSEEDINKTKSRIRRKGGGRKKAIEKDHQLKEALEALVEPLTRGDPESPLRWTCKSVRKLADELCRQGHQVSYMTVSRLLKEMDYSLQGNSKVLEGTSHPDRNEQFEYINEQAKMHQEHNRPVISVDTKKKELIGNFKNAGKEISPQGSPIEVNTHDFADKELGKANPYGVFDINRNEAWVNVGIDHDTSEFAVESIRRWWLCMGRMSYPEATELFITADSGGSNGYRVHLWKLELQKFANETGLIVNVSHFPPGTSKWNKIEHRLFSNITQNWRGKPLISHEVIVNLIANTTTNKGLIVRCGLDENAYSKGIKVTEEEKANISLEKGEFHGEWNYRIIPQICSRNTEVIL
jgi:transposase